MITKKIELQWAPYRPYKDDNVERYVPVNPGVYKLAVPNSEGTLNVFYVGQAENLRQRLKDHLSGFEANLCIRQHVQRGDSHFTYAVLHNKGDRDGAERALFDYWKPVCNKTVPPGPAIPINPMNG
jgi:excinuclease UvrABC nuclease subunit